MFCGRFKFVKLIAATIFITNLIFRFSQCDGTNLSAVANFAGIEEYYRDMRRKQSNRSDKPPTKPEEAELDAQIKQEICKQVLTSHFFNMKKKDWIDTNSSDVQEKLKENHKDIFFSIFEEYEYEYRCCLPCSGYGYDYRNAVRTRRVRIYGDEKGDEFVFKCLAKDQLSSAVEEYFVSQVYNVNDVGYSYPIVGRFIFSRHENEETLVMVAMAEEAAVEFRGLPSSVHYELNRVSASPADAPELDPVCSLTAAQKLRICTSVFGMSTFNYKGAFLPVVENVLITCQKKLTTICPLRLTFCEEWVIGCRASTRSHEPTVYYVSRGIKANTVYVYRGSSHGMILVHKFCSNVSGVYALIEAGTIGEDSPDDVVAEDLGERFFQLTVED